MISVSFFCTRQHNLDAILSNYQSYDIIDEILIVTLEPLQIEPRHPKIKIIHMPKDSDLGLLSRYTFALSCKNRFVFIQDDDWVYGQDILKEYYEKQEPLIGAHPRWFYNNEYQKQPQGPTSTAPILLTCGVLVDSWYLPAVIQNAKIFYKDYQNVFNGEDIFMSRCISKITEQKEFTFIQKQVKPLDMSNPLWEKNDNNRSQATRDIYNYFND